MTWTYSRWATYSATKRSQSISHSDLHLVYGIFMVLQQVRIVIVCLDGLPQLVLQRAHLARCFWHVSADFMGCCVILWSILVTPLSPPKQIRHIKNSQWNWNVLEFYYRKTGKNPMNWKVSNFPITLFVNQSNQSFNPKTHLALPNFLKLGNAALELCLEHTIFIGLNCCPWNHWDRGKTRSRCEKCSEKYMKVQWKTFWCPTQHFRIHLWDLVYPQGFAERLLNQKHFPFANKTWTCPLDTSNQSFQGYQKEVKCQLVE